MTFVVGFLVWAALGVLAGVIMPRLQPSATHNRKNRDVNWLGGTEGWLTVVFGIFGAFIGGMLGTSPYIFHDPTPLRVGSLIGALLGAIFFTFIYHFIDRKVV